MVPWWGFFLRSLSFVHWVFRSMAVAVQSAHNMCAPHLHCASHKHNCKLNVVNIFPLCQVPFIWLWLWDDFNLLYGEGQSEAARSWRGQANGYITTHVDNGAKWKYFEKDSVLCWSIYHWNGRSSQKKGSNKYINGCRFCFFLLWKLEHKSGLILVPSVQDTCRTSHVLTIETSCFKA